MKRWLLDLNVLKSLGVILVFRISFLSSHFIKGNFGIKEKKLEKGFIEEVIRKFCFKKG